MNGILFRVRDFAIRLKAQTRAAVMVEMAFVVPVVVLLGFAGLEIAYLTLTTTKISETGLSAADNAARIAYGSNLALPQIRERDVNDVFSGVEKQTGRLDFKQHGRLILSSLEQNPEGGQWIRWQRCFGDLAVASSYGDEGDGATGTSFPGMGEVDKEVKASAGTAVMFVEIVYDYQPLAYGSWLGPKRIRSTAAFNIREGRDLTRIYNAEGATVSRCQ
ncbi:MAG: TadE family protein [Sphingopyxis sp.]|uniref:TadE/TadG family type IV pilus assembly protein n=1 Tax=Sphingopyxis sp. TaxID=1908224 RepID=UPI002AB9B5C7|nr:TadE family protein [Sphingopyxis sp.]MDZ3830559.1 TadE family protein [Sphingopyxis sp.]